MDPEFSSNNYTPDRLIAGDYPLVTRTMTIKTGQGTLARGTVLAKDSANGDKLVPVDSASGTVSINDPVAILAKDADTSGGDVEGSVYLSGEFNEGELTFGGADTADTHRDAMRDLNMYLKPALSA